MAGETETERSQVATVSENAPAAETTSELPVDSEHPTRLDPSTASLPRAYQRGDQIHRYIILDELGSGGMGVVFSAYDPELDRKIAVKLLHVRPSDSGTRTQLHARLMREAQALAQLSHPNVISVYDVGTIDDDVFIAMELVEGRTLRDILREDNPSPARVLDLFLAAGRGLAAAHAAGLIHRDFKPDNVAVSANGRVCVLDFGLARAVHAGRDSEPVLHDPSRAPTRSAAPTEPPQRKSEPSLSGERAATTGKLLGAALTQLGTIMGTPSYMAPEQLRGEEVDARADQFSFCVGLYRGLFGKKPFPDDAPRTDPAPPPTNVRVPARLRRAVVKGLALDPAARHPSMDALLAELSAVPSRRLWSLGAVVVAAAAVVIYATVGHTGESSQAPALCRGAERKLAGVWEPAIKDRVTAAFVAAKANGGAAVAARASATLDRYTHDWVAMHTEACEATQVRGEQSTHVMDLRMQCLQRDLDRVAALVHLFANEADAALVDKATQAASTLPSLAACASLDALTAAVALPTDAAVAARVQGVRSELNRVEAMLYAGRYKQGVEAAKQAASDAQALPYPPVQAEALFLEGKLLRLAGDADAAEAAMRDALKRAGEARDHVLVARCATELLAIVGQLGKRDAEASKFADFAIAATAQAGNGDELRGQLLNNLGILQYLESHYTEALDDWKAGLAAWERALGPDHPDVLKTVTNLGAAYAKLGKYKDAIAYTQRAITTQEKLLGPDHPAVALSLHNLGLTQDMAGDHEAALKTIQRALAIDEATLGPDHPMVALGLQGEAEVLRALNRSADALPLLQRALAIRLKISGPVSVEVANTYGHLADTYVQLGRMDDALKAHLDEVATMEKATKPDHPDVAKVLMTLAGFYVERNRMADAWPVADRAREIVEKSAPLLVANAYEMLAVVRAAEKRYAEAEQLLQKAIAVDAKTPSDRAQMGERIGKLGDVYRDAGKPELAVASYERAVAYWMKEADKPDKLAFAQYALAQAIASKDPARAAELRSAAGKTLDKLGLAKPHD